MSRISAEISDEFLAQLKDDLVRRRVARGMARLEEHRHLLTSLDPAQKNAAVFAGCLAQWVDIGFERPKLVKETVALFSRITSRQAGSVLPFPTCRMKSRSSHFSFNSIPRLGLTLAAFSELTREVFLPDQSVRIVGAL